MSKEIMAAFIVIFIQYLIKAEYLSHQKLWDKIGNFMRDPSWFKKSINYFKKRRFYNLSRKYGFKFERKQGGDPCYYHCGRLYADKLFKEEVLDYGIYSMDSSCMYDLILIKNDVEKRFCTYAEYKEFIRE